MDLLSLPNNRFTHIVLDRPVAGLAKAWIDGAILQVDQMSFLAEIFALRQLQQRYETLGPRGVRLDVFDLEG